MIRGLSFSALCLAALSVSACSVFGPDPVVERPVHNDPAPTVESVDPWDGVPVVELSTLDTSGAGGLLPEEGVSVPEEFSPDDSLGVVANVVTESVGSAPVVSVGGTGGDIPTTLPEIGPVAPEDDGIPAVGDEVDQPAQPEEAPAIEEAAPVVEETAPTGPVTSNEAREAIQLGNQYYARGELRLARTAYSQALDGTLSTTDEADLIKVLGAINAKLFTSTASNGDLKVYTVAKGDSLSKIAREHNTTWQFLRRINGLDSNLIRINQELKVPRAKISLMVGNDFVKRYTVGLGKDGKTPLGEFSVINRIEKPMDKDVPFGDPRHRLGTHWLGLEGASGYEGYGIHGCRPDQYKELGTECSEGCVRASNEDAEELHDLLPVGAKVSVKA
jgi:LysM repeat protein